MNKRTSLALINDYKFILKQLAIKKVAQITHHRNEVGIDRCINITFAPNNQYSYERDLGPTLTALSLEQRCGMMVRVMYLSLEAFGTQLDSTVRSCSK